MARPRKFKTPKALERAWEEYKAYCNERPVVCHSFSSKSGQFVSETVKKCTTATIEGFCCWAKISRQAFYKYYMDEERFVDTVSRMREEAENDAREKFEMGAIPPQLAPLWMGHNYGYSTKTATKADTKTELEVVFTGGDDDWQS